MRPTEKLPLAPGRGCRGSPPGGQQVRQPGSHIPIPVRRGTGKRKKDKELPDNIQMSPQPLNEILKTIRPPRDNRQSQDKGNANRVGDLGKSSSCGPTSFKDNTGAKESFLPRKLRGSKKDSFKKTASQESKNIQSNQQRNKNESCSVIFRNDRKIFTEATPNSCNKASKKFREQPTEKLRDSNNFRNSNLESEENNYEQNVVLRDEEYGGSYEKDLNVLTGDPSDDSHDTSVRCPSAADGAEKEDCSECVPAKSTLQNADVLQCVVREVLVVDNSEVNRPTVWVDFQNEGQEDSEENPSDSSPTDEKCCLGSFSSPSEKEQSFSLDDDTSDSGDFGNPGNFEIVHDQKELYRKENVACSTPHQLQGADLEKESLREEVTRLRHIVEEERQRARQLLHRAQHAEQGMEVNETLRNDLEREKTLRREAEARLKEALCETERCKVELASLQNSVKAKDDANILLRTESSFAALKHGAPSHEGKVRRYQNRIAALEKENLILLNELKSLQPPKPYDPKDHEDAICRILTQRLEVLGQENSALTGENEHQRAQYEQCLDQVANQVVQTLLVQKKLEGDCKKLRSRVQELDEENKMLSQVVNDRIWANKSQDQMGPIPPSQEESTYQNYLSSHHSKAYSGTSSTTKPVVDSRVRPRDDNQGPECKIRNDLPGDVNRDVSYSRTAKESSKTLQCLNDSGSPGRYGVGETVVVNPYCNEGGRLGCTSRRDPSEKAATETDSFVSNRSSIPTPHSSGSSPKQLSGRRECLKKNKNYLQLPKQAGVKVAEGQPADLQTVASTRYCSKGGQPQAGDPVPTQIPSRWQKVMVASKEINCDVRRKRGSSKHGARPKSHQLIPGGEDSVFVLFHTTVDNSTLTSKRSTSYFPCPAVDKDSLYKSVVRRDVVNSGRLARDASTASALFSPLPESESSLSVEEGVGRKHKDEGYSTMSSDQQTDGLEARPEAEDDSQQPYHRSDAPDESVTECIDGSMSSSSDSGLGPLQYLAELSLNDSEMSEDCGEESFVQKSPRPGGHSRRALVLNSLASRAGLKGSAALVFGAESRHGTLTPVDTIPSAVGYGSVAATRFPSDDYVRIDDDDDRDTADSGSSSPWHCYDKDFLFMCDQKMQTAEKATLTEPEEQWRQKATAWSLEDSTWTLSASSSTTSCSSRGVGDRTRVAPTSPLASYRKFPSTDSSSETDVACWRRPSDAGDTHSYLVDKSSEATLKDSPDSTDSFGANSFQVAKHLLCRCGHLSDDQRFSNNLERVSSDSVLYLKDLFRNLESSMEPGLHAVKGRMDLHILPHSPPSISSNRAQPLSLTPDKDEQTGQSRKWTEAQPFAQEAGRPDQEEDRSPTTSLSSVYSSSSCQVATDEDEMGLGSVKCSRDPDLSSETDNEYDIEHKNFVEQWLQKEVCQPVPEFQMNQSDSVRDATIWRFSLLNDETRCFSNDELRSKGQKDTRASQNLYASSCDLRGHAEDSVQPLKDHGSSGKVQIVKPFSYCESGRTPSSKNSSCHQLELRGLRRDPLSPGMARQGPVRPSETSAVSGQSSLCRGFGRKYGSMTDVRSFGVATCMPLNCRAASNDGSSEEECVSECLQPAVKEFNSDFYKLCTVDSARSLMTSSRSLTTSDSSSQTEAEYIVQMESVSTDGNCAHSSSSDSEDCCCSRLLPPDRPSRPPETWSPMYRRTCLAEKRSPKRKNVKIRRKTDGGYGGVARGLEQDDIMSECQPYEEGAAIETGRSQCWSGDNFPGEEDDGPECGEGLCDLLPLHDGHQEVQLTSPTSSSSSGSRLKVCVNKMRRLGSSYFWRRRHLWKKDKCDRGKEGYETAWVHMQADVHFSDPQACAVFLDSVVGSSSSEEDVRLGSPDRRGPSHPRRHKHKAFSERRARANQPPQEVQGRASCLKCPAVSDDRQRAPLGAANDISATVESPCCPQDPEGGAPQQERIRGRKSSGLNMCSASKSDVVVRAENCAGGVGWGSPLAARMVNSLEEDLVDHISLSDSCAESYTSSGDSGEGGS